MIPNSLQCNPQTDETCVARRLDAPAVGDLELRLRFRFLSEKRQGLGLSLLSLVRFPTGDKNLFNGEDSVTFSFIAAVSKNL